MRKNVTQKLIERHLVSGNMKTGEENDYNSIEQDDVLEFPHVRGEIGDRDTVTVLNTTKNKTFYISHTMSKRQVQMILDGSIMNAYKRSDS